MTKCFICGSENIKCEVVGGIATCEKHENKWARKVGLIGGKHGQ